MKPMPPSNIQQIFQYYYYLIVSNFSLNNKGSILNLKHVLILLGLLLHFPFQHTTRTHLTRSCRPACWDMRFLTTAAKVSAVSFVLGVSIEWFMLHVQVGEETFCEYPRKRKGNVRSAVFMPCLVPASPPHSPCFCVHRRHSHAA